MDAGERTVLESPRRGAPDHTVLQNDPTIISSRHDERACFFVKAGPEVGKQFMLGEVSLLGRGRDCQVRLTDVRVGSRHAQVKLVSGHFTYQDLQSANGSFLIVGGRRERLRTDHVLADDDEIVVGDTTLKFMAVGGGRR